MRVAMWVVLGLVAVTLLLLGVILFFVLIIAMNGFSEAASTRVLLGYAILFLLTLIGSLWASRHSLLFLTNKTQWSPWLTGTLVLTGMITVTTIFLTLGSMILLAIGEG